MTKMTIRIDFDDGSGLGPGKVRLLELVAATGSIRKAASELGMSYRKAWLLVQALQATFGTALVDTVSGGKQGGGSHLTAAGRDVVARYRSLEKAAIRAATGELRGLASRARRASRP
jgi:molybdate transport system regulatory protein